MTATNPTWYVVDDTTTIKYHITDDNELDYTVYTEADGGRLDLQEDATIEDIFKLLEETL